MFRTLCVTLLVAVSYAANAAVFDSTTSTGVVQSNRKLSLAVMKSPGKKTSPKKSPGKKTSPKKSPGKKTSPKKSPAKGSPKKSPAKGSPKKSPAKGSPKKSPSMGGGGRTHVISVGTGGGFSFSPATLNVKVGDIVVFKAVTMGHNVMFTAGPVPDLVKLSNTAMFSSPVGYSYKIKIEKEGVYTFICGPHAGAGMEAKIISTL